MKQWCFPRECLRARPLPATLAPRVWHYVPIEIEDGNAALLLFPCLCPYPPPGSRVGVASFNPEDHLRIIFLPVDMCLILIRDLF